MRTRVCQWLEQKITTRGTRCGIRLRVLYGVQVYRNKAWHHVARNGKALIFTNVERAEKERAKLRKMKETT